MTSGPRYSYVGDLSSITTISQVTKQGVVSASFSATSSASETDHLVAEMPSDNSFAQHVEEEDGRHDASHARRKETREDAGSVSEAN